MQHFRYRAAVASLQIAAETGYVDLNKEDIEFMQQSNIWMAQDRNKARRIIEAFCYSALDLQGLPRFPLPAEYIAAAIVANVHECNYMVACNVMAGVEWTENLAMQRENPIQPEHLFALILQIEAGERKVIDDAEKKIQKIFATQAKVAAE